jgi:hypothetical protein
MRPPEDTCPPGDLVGENGSDGIVMGQGPFHSNPFETAFLTFYFLCPSPKASQLNASLAALTLRLPQSVACVRPKS